MSSGGSFSSFTVLLAAAAVVPSALCANHISTYHARPLKRARIPGCNSIIQHSCPVRFSWDVHSGSPRTLTSDPQ